MGEGAEVTDTAPVSLIDLAAGMLERKDARRPGLWPRASVLVARQALEGAVSGYWQMKKIPLENCSMHAQLICLREYLREGDLASRVAHAWAAMSRACHHHPYELTPSAEEIRNWMEPVRELREVVLRG